MTTEATNVDTVLTQAEIDELLAFKQDVDNYTIDDVKAAIILYHRKDDSTAIDEEKLYYLEEQLAYLKRENKQLWIIGGLSLIAIVVFLLLFDRSITAILLSPIN